MQPMINIQIMEHPTVCKIKDSLASFLFLPYFSDEKNMSLTEKKWHENDKWATIVRSSQDTFS